MNDELKLKLSAYLDGALPAAEASAFELEIAKSPELLGELEELRAVSRMVKDLPREPLPTGFRQRLERRRAAGDAPAEREWVFLAPAYRPFAAALSGLIVAVVVWDKVGERPLPVLPYDGVAVMSAANAPPVQYELANNINPSKSAAEVFDGAADKKEADAAYAATEPPAFSPPAVELPEGGRQAALVARRERVRAKGAPLEPADDDAASQLADAAPASMMEQAAPKPAAPSLARQAKGAASVRGMAQTAVGGALSEEERSARNEQMYKAFEKEKRTMGIAGFAAKDDAAARAQSVIAAAGGAGVPARIDSLTPNLLGAKDGVLPRALRSESAYRDAWAALKLEGEPPVVDFTKAMIVVLPEPGAVISADESAKELLVAWRRVAGGGPPDRLKPVAFSGLPVRLLRRD